MLALVNPLVKMIFLDLHLSLMLNFYLVFFRKKNFSYGRITTNGSSVDLNLKYIIVN